MAVKWLEGAITLSRYSLLSRMCKHLQEDDIQAVDTNTKTYRSLEES
jgi:hypothetical protein